MVTSTHMSNTIADTHAQHTLNNGHMADGAHEDMVKVC